MEYVEQGLDCKDTGFQVIQPGKTKRFSVNGRVKLASVNFKRHDSFHAIGVNFHADEYEDRASGSPELKFGEKYGGPGEFFSARRLKDLGTVSFRNGMKEALLVRASLIFKSRE